MCLERPLCKCILERDLYIYYVGYFGIFEYSELRISDPFALFFLAETCNLIIWHVFFLFLFLFTCDLYMVDMQGELRLHMQCRVLQMLYTGCSKDATTIAFVLPTVAKSSIVLPRFLPETSNKPKPSVAIYLYYPRYPTNIHTPGVVQASTHVIKKSKLHMPSLPFFSPNNAASPLSLGHTMLSISFPFGLRPQALHYPPSGNSFCLAEPGTKSAPRPLPLSLVSANPPRSLYLPGSGHGLIHCCSPA